MEALVSKAAMILLSLHPASASEAFQQDTCLEQTPRRTLTLADQRFKLLALLRA
jgi:hypothetical protein